MILEAAGMHDLLRPFERNRVFIACGGESIDRLADLLGIRGTQVAKNSAGEDAEPDFDLVQP